MRYLNLGCGGRFHPEWENVDMYAYGPAVRVHDLTKKLPYADEAFDVVYHSHVLEHFSRKKALLFLMECRRLLKPSGVVRVAVPDLERIARLYLQALEKASNGEPGWDANYEWMVMEMYDQCIREESCGALVEYLNRNPIPNWSFILERWGTYAQTLAENLRANRAAEAATHVKTKRAWGYVFRSPGKVLKSRLMRTLLSPEELEQLRVVKFRRGGEIHMWMYDRYSLGSLLKEVGLADPLVVGPTESRVPGWAGFNLDTDPEGRVYKADSMYMEAVKS